MLSASPGGWWSMQSVGYVYC